MPPPVVVEPPPVPVPADHPSSTDLDPRDLHWPILFDECKRFAAERKLDPWPLIYRAGFMWVTESGGGFIYANDGKAFHPDKAQRRPGWDTDDQGNPLPAKMISDLYDLLRRSLDLPHDKVGNNGGSTGPGQKLSQDYVGVRFPGKTWGWGPMAGTMDPRTDVRLFLNRLVVTNERVYGGRVYDPIAADVLRVQQPKVSEAASKNYALTVVEKAIAVVDGWYPRYFTDGNFR